MLLHDLCAELREVLSGLASVDTTTLPPTVQNQLRRVEHAARAAERLASGFDTVQDAPAVLLPEVLRAFEMRWTAEAAVRGRSFELREGPGLPAGLGVPPLTLSRILDNLAANAVQHGDGFVRVTVERAAGQDLRFVVSDGGNGSGPATPHAAGPRGLQIVRALVESCGAGMCLGATAAGGFEVTVDFPARVILDSRQAVLAAQQAPQVAARSPAPPEPDVASDLAGLRILLAEDNPTNQMVAVQMLGMLKADVTVANDGVEAIAAFEVADFDLVVVDIEMPRMSGLDVIRSIRSRRDGRERIPIVALTAYAMQEHRERIAQAGANGLISKPISSIDSLARALGAHVPRRASPSRPGPAVAAPPEKAAGKAAEAVVSDEPVVERAIYDALADAIGSEMMAELLEKVIADLHSARADLRGAEAALDRDPIRSASHILISVAGAFGASRLQHCARALNVVAHREDTGELRELLLRCIAEIDAAVAYIAAQSAGV